MHQMIEPHVRELFLHRVLPQAGGEVREVDAVHLLVLVEAREDDRSPLPVAGSTCFCRHCAQTSFIMHCIGELMLPMPTCSFFRYGASTPWRAALTAAIMRSEPIAMMRSIDVERDERLAQLAVLVREHRLHDVAAEVRDPAGAPARSSTPVSVLQTT